MNIVGSCRSRQYLLMLSGFALSVIGAMVLLAGCTPVQRPVAAQSTTEPVALSFAVPEPQGRTLTPYVLEFVDQVKQLSNGSMTVEPAWDPMAGIPGGNERGLVKRVLDGDFDLAVIATRAWDDQNVPSLHVLQAPFLITDDALAEAVATSKVATRLLDNLSSVGAVGLTMWPEDLRHPFSEMPDEPLLAPSDFAGKVMRAGPANITIDLMKALGATAMLEDSGYQGGESGFLNAYNLFGKPTASGNVTFYPKFDLMFANTAAFDRLNEEQRAVLQKAAAAAQAKAIAERPKEVDSAAAWCKDGGAIVLASPEQLAALEKAAKPVYDQIEADPTNAELIAEIRDLKAHTTPAPGAAACAPVAAAPGATEFDGLATGLDNATQARIRAVSALAGGPNVDVYINGLAASDGGKPQQNIPTSEFSGWLYVPPGSYSVALVPHGGTLDQALFAPQNVQAEAGHRYTVAAMGDLKDNSVKPLVVDETAVEAAVGVKPTNDVYITINNLKGTPGLDLRHDGKLLATTNYGEAAVMVCPSNERQFEQITPAGKPDMVIASAEMWCHLDASSASVWYGDYPGSVRGSSDSIFTSETTNVLDFLAEYNSQRVVDDNGQVLSFNILLSAIDKADMRDQFSGPAPYFLLAPTDAAFDQLPKGQLDALLNNPETAAKLIKTHLIPGYYPYGNLSGSMYGQANAEVTNLLGQKLRLSGSNINGEHIEGPNFTVGNGNRVQLVDKLLPVTP